MITIKSALKIHLQQLAVASDSPRLDAELLLAHVLDRDRTFLYTWPEFIITKKQYHRFKTLLRRRQIGEPIAHLTGKKEFWSLSLAVDNTTLIPRPETELLVETALSLWPDDNHAKTVLDLGAGTGAIALAIAKERPSWQIIGVEKYLSALHLAQKNLQRLQSESEFCYVSFRQSDWFSNLESMTFDLIISNPPYIDSGDHHLQRGDVRFEPRTALVSAANGLADIANIIQSAPDHMTPNSWLLLEHGFQQATAVRELLNRTGFRCCLTKKDLSKKERISGGLWCTQSTQA